MDAQPRLYLGHVMHRRLRPAGNRFVYPVFFVQLPLRRLAEAACPVFSIDRPNLLSFRSRDHGPRDGSALLPWIERRLADAGLRADGEIMLQTFPRVLGYLFNPVSFWYCHDRDGRLIAVLADVHNTFGGSCDYLLHEHGAPLADGGVLRAAKRLHVSPFNQVTGRYRFRFVRGAARELVRIDYDDSEGELLHTAISGVAHAWSTRALLAAFLRMPFLTLGITARIHWQALKLWLKGVPFHGADPGPRSTHTPIQ